MMAPFNQLRPRPVGKTAFCLVAVSAEQERIAWKRVFGKAAHCTWITSQEALSL
jgi:hypothetical protein